MDKIKENFKKFITVWGIILLINQIFIFGACFFPTCILAALPHTGLIAFFITLKLIKNDTPEKLDNSTEYVTRESRKKEIKNSSIDVKDINKRLEDLLDNKIIMQNNADTENHKLLNKLNSKYIQLNHELNKLKMEKEEIIAKIEQFEYRQFNTFGSQKLKLLSLKKDNSQETKDEYVSFLNFYQKYQMYKPKEKKHDIKNVNVDYSDNVSDIKLKSKNIESNINYYKRNIEKLKENKTYQCLRKIVNQNRYFEIEKEKIEKELDILTPKIEKKGLRIVKKATKLRNKELILSVDNELENIKLELKSLEEKLQNLVIEKTEYLNDIEEFNTQYNIHLGDIIKSILSLKKEILYKKTIKYQKTKDNYEEEIKTFDETKETITELKETISELEEVLENIDIDDENYDEIYEAYKELQKEVKNLEDELYSQEEKLNDTKEQLEDDELFNEYEDVKSAYDEFENEYEHIKDTQKDINKLNDDEKIEIKKLYKKAARLCHPDIVADELKEKALEIMQSLNDAYSKKDITKVKEIFLSLETGKSFDLSSDKIEDKEILKAKIEEFKKTIQELKDEIEEIKSDDTFVTISSLDDWDEYFEELKNELKVEKEKLEVEAQEILEEKRKIKNNDLRKNKINEKKESIKINEIEKEELIKFIRSWIISKISKQCDSDITNDLIALQRINYVSNDVYDDLLRKNLTSVNLPFITKDFNGSPINFIKENITFESLKFKKENKPKTEEKISNEISGENSSYSKHIQSIENIKFEKIRKYCENLSRDNSSDEMQKYLGLNGKMHKALIYSSLEVFIEELNGENITLIDWGCNQGIASMLVLDYIKEKQLDIKVEKVILIDDEEKALSRAIAQVEALLIDKSEIIAINTNDNNCLNKIKNIQKDHTFNLFANNKMPIDFLDIDYDLFDESYFMCLSDENENFINEVYENISIFKDVQDMSIRNDKIGKFKRYERVFKLLKTIDIDEIPF